MASTSLSAIVGACTSTGSKTTERRTDFQSRRPSSSLCISSGTTFRLEDRSKAEPWRLSGHPSRSEREVVRCQAIIRDNLLERVETVDETDKEHELVIVGAGLAGLATAASMNKIGVKSLVLEQSSVLRTAGSALSLWKNAWHVLDVLEVGDKLRSLYSPISGIRLLNQNGDLLRSFELDECPGGPHEYCGVERKVLVDILASVLPQETIRFNARVVSIKRESEVGPFQLTLADGSVIRTKVLLGADGVNSVVAKWMGLPQTRFAGYMGIRGLAIYPDGHPFGTSVRQYIGAGSRAGVTPISLTKVYWFFTFNKSTPGPKVIDAKEVKEELLGLLVGWPELIKDMLERTPVESLSRAALSDRWNLPGTTPVVQNGVTLAGDALHPMTPNLGQGGCCALEDAIVLARALGPVLAQEGNANCESITKALEEYATERQKRTLPLTIKSFVMGSLLQIPFPLVVFVRDKIAIPKVVRPSSFLSHTLYNPGQLPITHPCSK